jgi:cytochrome c553
MRRLIALGFVAAAPLVWNAAVRALDEPPAWAYAIAPPPAPGTTPPAPDTSPKQIPGSTGSFTRQQVNDRFGPADWFPGDHPAMPEVVAHGKRAENAMACALCHYPNGKGRQENAGVSGLPVSYFIQQMNDFRNGLRKSADTRKGNTNLMINIAKAMTPEEIKAAAEYFGSIKWTPWVRVIEADTVPKMESRGGIWKPIEGGAKEPIGVRIMETPVDFERTELRDPRSGFIAYVPKGSIKKGEALVKTGGNGRTEECGVCHGADLQGLGPVPGIAGRSPSYLVRQMYDMQAGARRGEWADLMKAVVAKLTPDDLVNIAAYVSSRMPPSTSATR